ncbi:MAG: hypothetical protein WBO46_19860 [Caldilineaceae bacterium]
MIVHKLISLIVALGMVLTPVTPARTIQSSSSPVVLTQTTAIGPDLLFRTHATVNTSAAWHNLEQLDPLFLQRGDDWALVVVDDAQLETLARLRFNPDGTDAIDALPVANPALAWSIPDLLNQIGAAKSQLAAQGMKNVMATADEPAVTALRATLHTAVLAMDSRQQAQIIKAIWLIQNA